MDILFSSFSDAFSALQSVVSAVLDVWFIIFPPLFYFLFKLLWKLRVQEDYNSKLKWVLLELIPPREIEQSPLPMESIFAGFAGVIKTLTMAEIWIKGEIPISFLWKSPVRRATSICMSGRKRVSATWSRRIFTPSTRISRSSRCRIIHRAFRISFPKIG